MEANSFTVFKKLILIKLPRENGFPTRSDTNRAVQSQKTARGLKFTKKRDCAICVLAKNKGADQVCGY